ncbi:MAG: cell division protein ZapA [candidate division KSB1 bacterium]|nr:cell division protein ZapA [candidate division KSB1 bacterium]
MNDNKKSLKVTIYGTEYALVSESDPNRVEQIAKYVDNKMREIQKASPNRTIHQIAILAALNIADELFHLGQSQKRSVIDKEFETRLKRMNKKLKLGIDKISDEYES